MNIAMLGQKSMPSREGGVEVVVKELSTRMAGLGHDVTCLNRYGKKGKYKGVKVKNLLNCQRKGFSAMTSSISGAIVAAFGKYDVVHFHAEGQCAMLWLPKLFGKRCIVTIHGLDHQRARWGNFAKAYIMRGERCAVKYADEIIVLSKNMQQYFDSVYQRKTNLIPNGVSPIQKQEINLIKKWGLQKDDYILYLARIVPEKGAQYLIKAFLKTKTDKKLVIAGGYNDAQKFVNELREMAKSDKRIIFTGFVSNERAELYSNSYLYVLPSDVEGMPLSLLEAMSYGNCCVVSSIPECVEIVEDKAITFKAKDVKDLSQCLQKLCDNNQVVSKYKKAAKNFIDKKCTWDEIVQQTMALYIGGN